MTPAHSTGQEVAHSLILDHAPARGGRTVRHRNVLGLDRDGVDRLHVVMLVALDLVIPDK